MRLPIGNKCWSAHRFLLSYRDLSNFKSPQSKAYITLNLIFFHVPGRKPSHRGTGRPITTSHPMAPARHQPQFCTSPLQEKHSWADSQGPPSSSTEAQPGHTHSVTERSFTVSNWHQPAPVKARGAAHQPGRCWPGGKGWSDTCPQPNSPSAIHTCLHLVCPSQRPNWLPTSSWDMSPTSARWLSWRPGSALEVLPAQPWPCSWATHGMTWAGPCVPKTITLQPRLLPPLITWSLEGNSNTFSPPPWAQCTPFIDREGWRVFLPTCMI